jgi:hypothetical protein
MKKLFVFTLLSLFTTLVFAQKDKSKSVDTKYLSLPSFDVSNTDLSTLKAEFAMAMSTFGTEKQKESLTACVPKGGGIKDAVQIKTYYYEVPVVRPDSYLVVKDKSGNILYAEQSSEQRDGMVMFGFEQCTYWVLDKLKKDWEEQAPAFKGKMEKEFEDQVFQQAKSTANSNITLSYINLEVDVYAAKGKNYDYAALDEAFTKALSAYEGIDKNGPNEADFKTLKECIAIWEKELESADLEDKKARITKDIAKGLRENCAMAYMFMYDFDQAIKHSREYKVLWGNYSNNRSTKFDELVKTMEMQKIAAGKNEALLSDMLALRTKAEEASSSAVMFNQLNSEDFARLKEDYSTYMFDQYANVVEARKEEEAAAIANGDVNPYQKYVNLLPPSGPNIMMNMAPNSFNGLPELTELPLEICELDLKQLMIRSNLIASVPPEIGKMENLEKLDLTGNKLTTLPPEIGQLKKLKSLKLGKNPIESLPPEIANCESLKTLDLKETALSDQAKEQLETWLPKCKIKY